MSTEHRHMPDANRLSVLAATVLLAYALAHLVETQRQFISLNLLGVALTIPVNLTAASTLMAAGLTAAGMNWLLHGHPQFTRENTFQHWILPALTAFVVGVPLYNLPPGPAWWLSFGLGGVLLLLVFLAEYIALDTADARYPAASAGLVALSYVLFLILTTTISFSTSRLAMVALAVFPSAGLVALRALRLRSGTWAYAWALGIGLILTQFAATLHYWPLRPLQYGLLLLGILYTLTELALNLGESVSPRRAGLEAALQLAFFWGAALFL